MQVNHVDADVSTNQVFTRPTCKESQTPFIKKNAIKLKCKTTM